MTNLSKPSLSIIVGITNATQYTSLIDEISQNLSSHIELIIIDQVNTHHAKSIDSIYSTTLHVGQPVGASKARNIGASLAKGNYLWFIDSDCTISAATLYAIVEILFNSPCLDLAIFRRVYNRDLISESFPSIDSSSRSLSTNEILHLVTEWNFVVRKSSFLQAGGFPLIGTGANHPAQSGECYAFICQLLTQNPVCTYVKSLSVSHPHYACSKPFFKTIGYYYGAGFAACRYSPLLKRRDALFQIFRNLAGTIYILFRASSEMLLPSESLPFPFSILIRLSLFLSRLTGSVHGLASFVANRISLLYLPR